MTASRKKNGLNLSRDEIEASFRGELSIKYPPVLTTQQVADLLQLPVQTIYQMSSQGRFETCARKVGKHLKFYRDRLLQAIFNNTL